MAYTMAYTLMAARRGYKTGSLFQRCEKRYGCPDLIEGPPHPQTGKPTKVRPKHKCKGRWYGVVEAGNTADGGRARATVSGTTKGVVQRRLDDMNLEKSQARQKPGRKKAMTVAKWTEKWLEELVTEVRPSSLATDKAASKWIVKTIGHVKLSELEPDDVKAVAAAIRRDGGSSSTALRYHGSLIRLLKAAIQDGYTVPSNVLVTKKPKAAANDRDKMTPEQCLSVVEFLTRRDDDGHLLQKDASRWVIALLQGVRQAEAFGLTWHDGVDFDVPKLTIKWQVQSLPYKVKGDPSAGFLMPDGYEAKHLVGNKHLVPPKSKKSRRVMPLIPWAEVALREWQQTGPANPLGLVWPGRTIVEHTSRRGKMHKAGTWPMNGTNDRERWEEIQRAVKIAHPEGRPFHVHEIRHSTASLLQALGVDEGVRIAIMGHSTIASTKSYEHVDMAPMLAALQLLGSELGLPSPDRSLLALEALKEPTEPS